MQAIVQRRYGGPEQFALAEVPVPQPGPEEVLVRVAAAGLDRGTWHLMTGLPLLVRLGFGLRGPKHPTPGRDLAGTVTAVGEQVADVEIGADVIGTADGSFAEYAVVPTSRLAPKPASLSFAEAAILPVSGGTALQAVRKARIRPGDRVLVIGASGGVGSYTVQLAVAAGARVSGVCSAVKADFVRSLGAEEVIDYARGQIPAVEANYDVIIDTGGNRPLATLRGLLAPRGTLIIVGGEQGGTLAGGIGRQLRALAVSAVQQQRLVPLLTREVGSDLAELARYVEAGTLRPTLDRTYPLGQAATAMTDLVAGRVRGKVALTLTPADDEGPPHRATTQA